MDTKFAVPFELKKLSEDGTFEGYGSVFDVVDSYKEVVKAGAFKKSLAAWKKKGILPPMLWQHDSTQPIGKYISMREDTTGLYVEGKLLKDDLPKAKEAYILLREGVVTGLSIGFQTVKHSFDTDSRVRFLEEVNLWELSLVTFPANQEAGVTSVKSCENIATVRDFEDMLRLNGFSDRESMLIASKGFAAALSARESRQQKANAGEPPSNLNQLAAALKRCGDSLKLN